MKCNKLKMRDVPAPKK